MALLQVFFHSEVLGKQVQMNVILPQRSRGQIGMASIEEKVDTYPTLYLLHGMSDDHTIWERRTSIERYVSERGIAVVMPNADLSWYTDMVCGAGRYFTFFSEELPAICRDFFPKMSPRREDTFVAGLSMGGYGAFKLALNCPQTFSCGISLSGALDPSYLYSSVRAPFAEMVFGNYDRSFKGSVNDLYAVSEKLAASDRSKPRLYQWCGTEDFLYGINTKMRDHLLGLGFDLTYKESEGNHAWQYWDKWIQDALDWLPIRK
ncbi:MAG: esterase family protein [Clostridia bacterium]|nr:esterase family protein [Clostridia bacterium]